MKVFILNLIYVLLVFLLKIRFIISFNVPFAVSLVLFVLGGALGHILFYLNYFFYPFLSEKEDELATKTTTDFFQKKEYVLGISFLMLNEEKMKFNVLKTAINFLILLILTFFVSFSSGSFFGTGVCFGLIFHFSYKLINDFKNPVLLNQWFEQIKRPVEFKYQQIFVYVAIGLTILISL